MKLQNFKALRPITMGILATFLLVGCNDSTSEVSTDNESEKNVSTEAEFIFKLGHAADENNTWHKGVAKFAEEVSLQSQGRIEIKLYPNEQLGNEVDNVTAIQAKTADMVLSGESLQNWAEKVGIMSTPYLIRDSKHLDAVVNGEPGKIIEAEILEKAGLKVLAYFERGPRMLTSNIPINSIEDLQGLQVRLPNVPLFVSTWNHWGAKPVPMAFSEVFTSLQQNTIEAQENPLALLRSGGFYEVQEYINNTEHVRGWIYLLIGEEQWNSLPDDLKTVMEEAAEVAQQFEHELFLEEEDIIFQELTTEHEMKFIETDTSGMIEAAEKLYETELTPELKELYELIKAVK